jgi:hypothetical protein
LGSLSAIFAVFRRTLLKARYKKEAKEDEYKENIKKIVVALKSAGFFVCGGGIYGCRLIYTVLYDTDLFYAFLFMLFCLFSYILSINSIKL